MPRFEVGDIARSQRPARRERLFPVHYCHVVFTLPSELRELFRAERRRLLGRLMRTAAHTLLELGGEAELGAEVARVVAGDPRRRADRQRGYSAARDPRRPRLRQYPRAARGERARAAAALGGAVGAHGRGRKDRARHQPHGLDRGQHQRQPRWEAERQRWERIDGLALETSGTFWRGNGERLPWQSVPGRCKDDADARRQRASDRAARRPPRMVSATCPAATPSARLRTT